jgi:hypothetical protein
MSHYKAWNAQRLGSDLGLTREEVQEQVEAMQALARAREAEFAENRRKFYERQLREIEEQRQRAEDARMAQELAEAWEEARRQSWKAWRERNSHKIDSLVPFTHGTKTNQWE